MKKKIDKEISYEQFCAELRAMTEKENNRPWFSKALLAVWHLPYRIKEGIRRRKLRRLSLGKSKYCQGKLYIEKISPDIAWQMNNYLPSIIRDYLLFYEKRTPIIGNCVVPNDRPDIDSDELYEKWKAKLRTTAELFDGLTKTEETYEEDCKRITQERVNEAFQALSEVFLDLTW